MARGTSAGVRLRMGFMYVLYIHDTLFVCSWWLFGKYVFMLVFLEPIGILLQQFPECRLFHVYMCLVRAIVCTRCVV